ncbi:MAG: ABC transporter substrate-binding protein, partial [Aquificaceae bacterium]
MIKALISALFFCVFMFLPFYLASSPKGGSVSFVRLKPQDFKVELGRGGGQLRFVLSSDPKTLNPAIAQETSSTAVLSDLLTGLTKIDLRTMQVV